MLNQISSSEAFSHGAYSYAASVASLQEAASGEVLKLILCAVGEQQYCVDMTAIKSVERLDLFQGNPKSEDIAGWLLGKETEVPIFNLARRLKQEKHARNDKGRILIFNSATQDWGILVDQVSSIVKVKSEEVFAMPALAQSPYQFFRGIVRLNGKLVLYLSPEHLNPETASHWQTPDQGAFSFRSLAIAPPGQEGGKEQAMFFRVADAEDGEQPLSFGLSFSRVRHILEHFSITPVPSSPAHVLGIIDWVEGPVPVVDFSQCVGLGATAFDDNTRLLLARVEGGKSLVAFPVRDNLRTVSLPVANLPYTKTLGLNEHIVKATFELLREVLVIPDIERVCSFKP